MKLLKRELIIINIGVKKIKKDNSTEFLHLFSKLEL